MEHPARSPETVPALVTSCWFIFAGMCKSVFIHESETAQTVWPERISKKYDF